MKQNKNKRKPSFSYRYNKIKQIYLCKEGEAEQNKCKRQVESPADWEQAG